LLLVLVGLFTVASPAGAVDGTYINPVSGGRLERSSNWAGGNIADGPDAIANFNTLDLSANNTGYLRRRAHRWGT
jgi:hypothetical protein